MATDIEEDKVGNKVARQVPRLTSSSKWVGETDYKVANMVADKKNA